MKPIANIYTSGKIKEMGLPRFDGELLTYTGDKLDDFNTVQSKLSTRTGMPDFRYMVFDSCYMSDEPYISRNSKVETWFNLNRKPRIEHVKQVVVENEEQLLDYEAQQLALGWEGVMVRSFNGRYKHGRSTTKEGILLKLKRFFDDEAVVVSAHELVSNTNEATMSALGYIMRSSNKENMIPQNMLGKFTVKWKDVEFDIGTGFDLQQRNEYWRDPRKMIGLKLTFKYQSVGPNGKPRFPVFLGFRND
jgi:DNA ligase-1